MKEYEKKKKVTEEVIAEHKQKFEKQQKEYKQLKSTNENASKEKKLMQRSLKETQNALKDADSDRRHNERSARMADTLELLKTHFNGVLGRVLDLCKPQKVKYNLAITIALGTFFFIVIVERSCVCVENQNNLWKLHEIKTLNSNR